MWVVSSAVEHYLDMVRVTGSIPVPPTILLTPNHLSHTSPKSTGDFGRLRDSYDLCWRAETNSVQNYQFSGAGISRPAIFGQRNDACSESRVTRVQSAA